MPKIDEFLSLAGNTREKILEFGTTNHGTFIQFDRCIRLLKNYLEFNNLDFSNQTAFKWFNSFKAEYPKSRSTHYYFSRTINLLLENNEGLLTHWKCYQSKAPIYPVSEGFINLLEKYRTHIQLKGYATSTITIKIQAAKKFLVYLEQQQVFLIRTISNDLVSAYFASESFSGRKPTGVQSEVNQVKHFFTYLVENNLTDNKFLLYTVPIIRTQVSDIITTITEVAKVNILSNFPNLPTNKREKAKYLLALHLGLRQCDIVGIKFADINWKVGTLQIKQQKTQVTIKFKIDSETQNALIDYILNERRQVESNYIFIRSFGPLTRVNKSTGTYRRTNDIDVVKHIPSSGLHILRRTFASNLLKSGSALPVISAALGHTNEKNAHRYLSVDEENLKRCALGIASIPVGRSEF
jgi:site-specific recombinase XerD